jgi:hypothetical protein
MLGLVRPCRAMIGQDSSGYVRLRQVFQNKSDYFRLIQDMSG